MYSNYQLSISKNSEQKIRIALSYQSTIPNWIHISVLCLLIGLVTLYYLHILSGTLLIFMLMVAIAYFLTPVINWFTVTHKWLIESDKEILTITERLAYKTRQRAIRWKDVENIQYLTGTKNKFYSNELSDISIKQFYSNNVLDSTYNTQETDDISYIIITDHFGGSIICCSFISKADSDNILDALAKNR